MDLDSYTKYEMDTEMVLMQEYDGCLLYTSPPNAGLSLAVISRVPTPQELIWVFSVPSAFSTLTVPLPAEILASTEEAPVPGVIP